MKKRFTRQLKKYHSAVVLSQLVAAFSLLPPVAGSCLAGESAATVNDTISQSLKGDWGQIKANLRYRYERVEQDGLETAEGDPVRLRLGYQTPKLSDLRGYVEFMVNTTVFMDDFNDTVSGENNEYAAIPDPDDEALNQLWLSYDGTPDTTFTGGRQKISYDNHRFVSPCAFRQLEQTLDAITMLNESIGNFYFNAAYLWNVLNIKNQEINMQTPLVNMKYTLAGIGSFSGYGYWLDYDDPDNSGSSEYANSTQTLGLRFTGSAPVSETFKLLYTAEYANQSDFGDNPKDFEADYYHVNGGVMVPAKQSLFRNISAKVGYEILGSDSGVPLQTPLGANHKFNGWADIFGANKPANGLRDLYGSLATTVAGVKVDLVYHEFEADEGDSEYGSEFDVKLTWKFLKNYTIMASYSTYDADEYKKDTDKYWLELTVNF